MKHGKIFVLLLTVAVAGFFGFSGPVSAQEEETFADYCTKAFQKEGTCPAAICRLQCQGGKTPDCVKMCVPRKCTEISPKQCPSQFCALMVDCSKKKICHYQMEGGKPACGDVAYAGQDVRCCPGLIRRCGYEFVDGTCDMEGKNSVYNLPICIPCGNGVCENFEDRCNCPEDCGRPPKHGGSMRDLPFVYIKHPPEKK